jgi:uncharacterized membrane protein
MTTRRSRITSLSADDLRASLWFWPSVAALAALCVTLLLLPVRPEEGTPWALVAWPGNAESASILLQVVATALMAATTLTFSLTVVALQLASQQFSPRLLREFARDRFTQGVLALLVSTFVVALTGIRGVDTEHRVPVLVVALAFVLAICSALALLTFVGHIVRSLRVDTMMVAVHEEAVATIAEAYPDYGDRSRVPAAGLPGQEGGTLVVAQRSGFVRVVRGDRLVRSARQAGIFMLLGIRPGDHVVEGTPIASVWADDRSASIDHAAVSHMIHAATELGFERTIEQDVALGLRQLTDIAVKAISPGINDPITAAHAVGYCGDILVRLQGRHLGPQQHDDSDGVPRVVLPDRDHRYYLDLVCAPVRRFGRGEPLVLTALLRMLRDCAVAARDEEQRSELLAQAQLVLEQMSTDLLEYDIAAVRDFACRVELAIRGDVGAAYRDRAGETRSM